jgi:hypothetical protein
MQIPESQYLPSGIYDKSLHFTAMHTLYRP